MTLTASDIEELRGINVALDMEEVERIFLPMSRLLNLYVAGSQSLYQASATFLGEMPQKVPFVLGIAGSVAVGKSTTARVLQALLGRWPDHPKVDLVTTDGFLWPNAVLEERGIMDRKGFPESYDRRRLIRFMSEIKSGADTASAPVYDHLTYDRTDEKVVIERPDIVIVEGLNVLQTGQVDDMNPVFVSDYFDFSIYVHAQIANIQDWYVERFFTLRETAFKDSRSYFRKYGDLTDEEANATATGIWKTINEKNLVENILPTRSPADLIINKGTDHRTTDVQLRRQ